MPYKILAINPGSTSTKISVANDCELLFVEDVKHSRSELEQFHTIFDQYEYRKQHILQELKQRNIPLDFDDFRIFRQFAREFADCAVPSGGE